MSRRVISPSSLTRARADLRGICASRAHQVQQPIRPGLAKGGIRAVHHRVGPNLRRSTDPSGGGRVGRHARSERPDHSHQTAPDSGAVRSGASRLTPRATGSGIWPPRSSRHRREFVTLERSRVAHRNFRVSKNGTAPAKRCLASLRRRPERWGPTGSLRCVRRRLLPAFHCRVDNLCSNVRNANLPRFTGLKRGTGWSHGARPLRP
jgi:hypothetical protein